MDSGPTKRRSLRPNDDGALDNTDKDLSQCEVCNDNFLVNENGTETKLSDEDIKTWYDLTKNKEKNPSTPDKFKCKRCKLPKATRHQGYFKSLMMVFAIFLGISVLYNYREEIEFQWKRLKSIPVNEGKETKADKLLDKGLYNLETLYKNQIEDTWITLTAGIKSVIRETPNKPSMFLMLFDSDSGGNTATCIANAVSKQAITYLMQKSGAPEIIHGSELNKNTYLEDPGLLLTQLKNDIKVKGALVVINLHEVPPKVAKMFHYVCDRYSPLVEKAVTFFTLQVDSMPAQMNLQVKAEERMKDLWSSVMEDNELRPLITRMTSNIIRIYPDSACKGIDF